MAATGATAKWVAGFFFMPMIVMIALCSNYIPVAIAFLGIRAWQAWQQQDVKGEYE